VAALLCAVALAAPASALGAEPPPVDGATVSRADDPFVPGPEAELPPARGAGRARAGSPRAGSAAASRGARALDRALRRARRARHISAASARRYARIAAGARRTVRRLGGGRRRELGYVLGVAEQLALRGRLTSSRMPAVFLLLDRNARFWGSRGSPRSRSKVRFRGSELLFEYYPGRGLQLQPLANFIRANLMHRACALPAEGKPCRRDRLRRLLDAMGRLASRRSHRFVAWEYFFEFGGGRPPWMSAMAQATGIQALARGASLLGEPRYVALADRALPAFAARPPVGVRTRGFRGGTHYLQYSFAPRLYIMNAFIQSLLGLYDYAKLTGSQRARELFDGAEPEAARELPAHDTGDWSRYSYRGRESTREYHELLREVLASLCSRLRRAPYCETARRFRAYQSDPAVLRLDGPAAAVRNRRTSIRFWVNKRSVVQVVVSREGRVGLDRVATFRRGRGSFAWRPRSSGSYVVRLSAKELRTGRGLRSRTARRVEVGPG
jgi:hypothetical protein